MHADTLLGVWQQFCNEMMYWLRKDAIAGAYSSICEYSEFKIRVFSCLQPKVGNKTPEAVCISTKVLVGRNFLFFGYNGFGYLPVEVFGNGCQGLVQLFL
jgi:hypothetical protein